MGLPTQAASASQHSTEGPGQWHQALGYNCATPIPAPPAMQSALPRIVTTLGGRVCVRVPFSESKETWRSREAHESHRLFATLTHKNIGEAASRSGEVASRAGLPAE